MSALWTYLRGKKSYCVAVGMICYAVLGVVLGQLEMQEAITLALEGAGISALRNGIG